MPRTPVVQPLLLTVVAILTLACIPRTVQTNQTVFTSLKAALEDVRQRDSVPAVFIVDGRVVEDVHTIPSERVRRVEIVRAPNGHCNVEYSVAGRCRPVLMVSLRPDEM